MIENARALRSSQGPAFAHWLERTRAAFGIVALDERPPGA